MTACILIISALTGEVVGCLPPERITAGGVSAEEAQWERLRLAVDLAKEGK